MYLGHEQFGAILYSKIKKSSEWIKKMDIFSYLKTQWMKFFCDAGKFLYLHLISYN